MEYYEIWFALFAVLGVAVVAPMWVHYVDTYLTSRPVMQLLSTMVLPMMAMLLVASWLQPG
jgi:hypothetical protein